MQKCEICINSDKPEICTNCKDFNKFQTDSTHKQEDAPEPTPDLTEEQMIEKLANIVARAVGWSGLESLPKIRRDKFYDYAHQISQVFKDAGYHSPSEVRAIERAAQSELIQYIINGATLAIRDLKTVGIKVAISRLEDMIKHGEALKQGHLPKGMVK